MGSRSLTLLVTLLLCGISAGLAANYTLKTQNRTCIIFESDISISVEYETKVGKKSNATWAVQDASGISGSCENNSAALRMNFSSPVQAEVKMLMDNIDGKVNLKTVNLTYTIVEGDVFKSPKNDSEPKIISFSPALYLSSNEQYYTCSSDVARQGKNFINFKNTKLQAFGIKDNTLSKSVQTCLKDSADTNSTTTVTTSAAPETTESANTTTPISNRTSTSSPTTTPMPTTSPMPQPPLLNATVSENGTICIVGQFRLEFSVKYIGKDNKTHSTVIRVPSSAEFSGRCGSAKQSLEIDFDGNTAVMQFSGGAGKAYTLSFISFNYTINGTFNSVQKKTTFFNANANSYYQCGSDLTFTLSDDVGMKTQNFTLQAFRSGNTTNFDGAKTLCDADSKTDNVVPIIVGCALAALVLIVLVAYIIGRRRSSGGSYQSV